MSVSGVCQAVPPVLLLIFNRPDTTKVVVDALRKIKPSQIYVAADGPRKSKLNEVDKTQAARMVVTEIDWQCEVKTFFREENMGCRRAVSSAIDWFFDQVEEGIILEDDCVPDPSYFTFAQELLARYRDDERVMVVAANHFHGSAHRPPHSYFFSRYNHCWGWASWRRAWKMYDREMSNWPVLRETDWLLGVGNGSRSFQQYWTKIFDTAYAGEVDSWAYRWTFSCWAANGLTILPAVNLVVNIGFGVDATHTNDSNKLGTYLKPESMNFPLMHPQYMVEDVSADAWSDRYIYGISRWAPYKKLARKIMRLSLILRVLRSS